MRPLSIAVLLSFAAPLAFGQTLVAPRPDDTVNLSLRTEDWVQTQTVRTELAVDAAFPGSDAGKVRGEILSSVKKLADGAEWRFTRFDHNEDSSGLERWNAVLEARLPEAQLSGLSDRAKQASKPGLQITFQQADFSPTLAEFETAKSKLRDDLYKKANEALAQLNQAEPDRKFRIMHIAFNDSEAPTFNGMARTAAMPAAPALYKAGGQDEAVERSQKLQLGAIVTFAAIAPHE